MRDVRADFPILQREIDGQRIVYLDSAATSLKPTPVIDAVTRFYTQHTANVHRAVHTLAEEATDAYEGARRRIARHLGAEDREIVMTRGTTEAIHIVRTCFPGLDRVVTTAMEHHSNLLPWAYGEGSTVLALDDEGRLDLDGLDRALDAGADLVALAHVSNAIGVTHPVEEIIARAHAKGALVLLDAAQSAGHLPVDVKALDVDFLACSSHKMLGPGGVGCLYAKAELLERMQPYQLGGHVVDQVHIDSFTLQEIPHRFEAGTPAIEAVIGWGAAVDYLAQVGLQEIQDHDRVLVARALERLGKIEHVGLVTPADPDRVSASVGFQVDNLEAHGVARMLNNRGNVLVRSGFHCAQPFHESQELLPTVRASFYLYNTEEDVDILAQCLEAVVQFL